MSVAVISHRAHGGTHPENTLAGIQAALDDGVDAIELDVRRTLDGELILIHDATFERTAGDRRVVAETRTGEMAGLYVVGRDGQHEPQPIPTLIEALRLVDGRAPIVLDFVVHDIADDCIAAVRDFGAESWTWWTAHDPRLAARLHEATPGSKSFLGWSPSEQVAHSAVDAVELAARYGLDGLMANHRHVDRTAVERAHRLSLAMNCWTINDAAKMRRFIALGVDGITTDYPRLLQHLIAPQN